MEKISLCRIKRAATLRKKISYSKKAIRTFQEFSNYAANVEGCVVKLQYFQNIFMFLDNMKPGQRIVIDDIVKERTKGYFINAVCLYSYLVCFPKIYFSDDWLSVYRER